jgi:hypothetical protein
LTRHRLCLLPNPTFSLLIKKLGQRNVKLETTTLEVGPEGPEYSSPGQRPGYAIQPIVPALKGRDSADDGLVSPFQGFNLFLVFLPKATLRASPCALPWAILFCPFRAGKWPISGRRLSSRLPERLTGLPVTESGRLERLSYKADCNSFTASR